jgi:peptidoglycan/xylan/chitin deacetylase (PgdA/CDA1 family)
MIYHLRNLGLPLLAGCLSLIQLNTTQPSSSWIRINQLGYTPKGIKVAVWVSKLEKEINNFHLVDVETGRIVFTAKPSKNFGSYGPFKTTHRLNFSQFSKAGKFYLQAGGSKSPAFTINNNVYSGTANFCLQYMRQQRSGFNPFLKDSCHTHDGYTMYGPMPDSTHIDVSGGWHDASDYLQYAATSANATWHLLAAYRDFGKYFPDEKLSNGLDGKNKRSDLLDEADWGLQWLEKMNPSPGIMFNQLADDRDHQRLRLPKEDSFYGKGFERPVYFITGEPQGLFKYQNRTKGTSSTAAKFSAAFALAHQVQLADSNFSRNHRKINYLEKAGQAYNFALIKPGVTQTAPGRAPYFYEEDNWVDDMELASASLSQFHAPMKGKVATRAYDQVAYDYAQQESVTPWLGADTARHYQYYPFINLGHAALVKQLKNKAQKDTILGYYETGIKKVWEKARTNAFYRGVPFIWCSNNLTTSFAIQCYWYRKLSGHEEFSEFEQANIDWLFGCNPWGTSMVYGLPGNGDFPQDPHSAFAHLNKYPINGGLVDGPVYTSIFQNLIGIELLEKDEYHEFQSDLAVYHDDFGDYSTNEPTMDGTASLIYLLAAKEAESVSSEYKSLKSAITRGDTTKKEIALVFTGDEYGDGGPTIDAVLAKHAIKASFFLTGNFYRNNAFKPLIKKLRQSGHYLGPHGDRHLLYCDWQNRDSLLITKKEFIRDLDDNIREMKHAGIENSTKLFLPPFEWYNDSIVKWSGEYGHQLICFTPGTLSTADYTWPSLGNYRSSAEIYNSILKREKQDAGGLNGYLLLLHVGTDVRRVDKFYTRLDELVGRLLAEGYRFKRVDEMLVTGSAD